MTQEHPITPPPELVEKWYQDGPEDDELGLVEYVATQAARWGADQELEACVSLMLEKGWMNQSFADNLRSVRRPKPPSLKELALTQLDSLHADLKMHGLGTNTDTIRRALEQLDV